ncbi:MAG: SRPBCC family protein [Actinomycetes bacterium]
MVRTNARVVFEVDVEIPLTSQEAWNRLTDWPSHGKWIPLTRIDVDRADPKKFVAYSGIRPLVLEDRMHQLTEQFDGTSGDSTVAKLGPILVGEARFAVRPGPSPTSCVVSWREDVAVKWLPRFLTATVAFVAKQAFASSIKKMAKY